MSNRSFTIAGTAGIVIGICVGIYVVLDAFSPVNPLAVASSCIAAIIVMFWFLTQMIIARKRK